MTLTLPDTLVHKIVGQKLDERSISLNHRKNSGRSVAGERRQFVGGAVLDRVVDPHDSCLESERTTLRSRGVLEFGRRHEYAGDPQVVPRLDVVQTARCARSSVGDGFDDDVGLVCDLLDDVG